MSCHGAQLRWEDSIEWKFVANVVRELTKALPKTKRISTNF